MKAPRRGQRQMKEAKAPISNPALSLLGFVLPLKFTPEEGSYPSSGALIWAVFISPRWSAAEPRVPQPRPPNPTGVMPLIPSARVASRSGPGPVCDHRFSMILFVSTAPPLSGLIWGHGPRPKVPRVRCTLGCSPSPLRGCSSCRLSSSCLCTTIRRTGPLRVSPPEAVACHIELAFSMSQVQNLI